MTVYERRDKVARPTSTYVDIAKSALAPFDNWSSRGCIGVAVVANLVLLATGIAAGARTFVVTLGLTLPTMHARNRRARPFTAMWTSGGVIHVTHGGCRHGGHGR
jgi:hypothetical protein